MKIQSTEILNWIIGEKEKMIKEHAEIEKADTIIKDKISEFDCINSKQKAYNEFYDFIIAKEKL